MLGFDGDFVLGVRRGGFLWCYVCVFRVCGCVCFDVGGMFVFAYFLVCMIFCLLVYGIFFLCVAWFWSLGGVGVIGVVCLYFLMILFFVWCGLEGCFLGWFIVV